MSPFKAIYSPFGDCCLYSFRVVKLTNQYLGYAKFQDGELKYWSV